jgi:ribosomal protein S18 acetylase RimI-like enzyme
VVTSDGTTEHTEITEKHGEELNTMEILNAVVDDSQTIFDLYDKAIEFQKTVFDKTWLGFSPELVATEITEKRLWKIVENGDAIACIFSVAYADPIIWGLQSHESAMYIHRIVTNPEFRGRAYVRAITSWAIEHARENGLRFVRMDTWGDNQKLIDYYRDCGFRFLGLTTPAESPTMPAHYRGIELSLFEIDLNAEIAENAEKQNEDIRFVTRSLV